MKWSVAQWRIHRKIWICFLLQSHHLPYLCKRMQSPQKITFISILISLGCVLLFHIHPSYIFLQWQSSPTKTAYDAYLEGDSDTAINIWQTTASWSVVNQYNLWTYLAITSISSWTVKDITRLQQAQQYLSWAATLDTTDNQEIIHNLTMVRQLLQETNTQQTWSTQQQPNEQQKKQSTWSGNQSQNGQQEAEKSWSPWDTSSSLSEATKEQLTQYQQQLQSEQAQNQQFFDKRSPITSLDDPFALMNQLFWGPPPLEQTLWTSGTKDR